MVEKRSYSRVDVRIGCHLRRAAEDERQRFHGYAPLSSDAAREVLVESKLPEGVVAFLLNLDAKLDMLLAQSSRRTLQDDFPISAEIVEISASGIKFRCDQQFTIGEQAEVVMVLGRTPQVLAGAMGRIKRRQNGTEPLWVFDFTTIREQDQEAVVRFVFQEQRAQIREKKWS